MLPALTVMRECVSEQSRDKACEVLERQVTFLRRIIDDLLDIARVAEGKLELQKARIDVRAVISDAVSATSTLFEEHRHELSVVLPDTAIWLDADRTRLLQVFANLLTNPSPSGEGCSIPIILARREDRHAICVGDADRDRRARRRELAKPVVRKHRKV